MSRLDQMEKATMDLVDTSDFCRRCKGKGGSFEFNSGLGHGRIWEPCDLCRGTGERTVRVDEAQK